MADLRYPEKLSKAGTMEGYVAFEIFNRKNRSSSNPEKTIWLYMPEHLESPNTVEWDSHARLGAVGAAIESAGRSVMDSGAGIGATLATMASAGTSAIIGEAASRVFSTASSLSKKLSADFDAEGVAGSVLGAIRNPYMTLLFKGVNLRAFDMKFKLYPHSKTETENISNIIKEFRKASLPNKSLIGVLLGYPKEFQITFKFEGKDNKYLHKFKRSALVGLSTNYTASGMWSVTRDGFPAEIELDLRFTEVEIVTREDIDEGY